MNCNGKLITFDTPKVMGILNITPDSFYSKSRIEEKNLLQTAEQMLIDGATFIDIGGYSSRPNAAEITQTEEIQRVIPTIEKLVSYFPDIQISVDTFRSEVARLSLEAGAKIINDISASELDPQMWNIVKKYQVPYIVMHMRGTPQNMQQNTEYQDITKEILEKYTVVINCTPLGTFPKTELFPPIPYHFLGEKHLLYDLIYNPEKTIFLLKGEEKGAIICNGYAMLVHQAEAAWKIWNE